MEVTPDYVIIKCRQLGQGGDSWEVTYEREPRFFVLEVEDLGPMVAYLGRNTPYECRHLRVTTYSLDEVYAADYWFTPAVPGAARVEHKDGTSLVAVEWQK